MNAGVRIGASMPQGMASAQALLDLKLGDFMLTKLPNDYEEALATARFCREHGIHYIYGEFLHRGSRNLYMMAHKRIPREQFLARAQLDRVMAAGGPCYRGRMVLGEAGGLLYWPKAYTLGRACNSYRALPPARTVNQANKLYLDFLRETLAYERTLTGGPLLDVDSSLTFSHHLEAGIDIPVIESMPGDGNVLYAALRGAARAYGRHEFGAHIAMHYYGGSDVSDQLWLQRWRVSLFFSFLSGATFIYPESGHLGRGRKYGFNHPAVRAMRSSLRECWRFARIHTRTAGGPRVRIGFVQGHLDGYPGLWNKYVWGQYQAGGKWLHGPPEWGWNYLDSVQRKEDWTATNVRGEHDFSGHPPGGLYDIVPAEAPAKKLARYKCLVFLGWNTMTPDLYARLKRYVKGGGHLVMAVPHLSTQTNRGKDLLLFRKGNVADLFGVRVLGPGKPDVHGVRYVNDCSLRSWVFSTWTYDQKFIGRFTPARVQVRLARVLAGVNDRHDDPRETILSRPLLVENSVGHGKAFLLTTWSWPGETGLGEFVRDILRALLAGEQGRIRVNGSDRLRHAVYEARGVTTVYLLNTDLDNTHTAALWVGGRQVANILVPPADVRPVFLSRGLVIVPADKFIDLKRWSCPDGRHVIKCTSLNTQTVSLYALTQRALRVMVNGKTVWCAPGVDSRVTLRRRVDPVARAFFAPDFMAEPRIRWQGGDCPY